MVGNRRCNYTFHLSKAQPEFIQCNIPSKQTGLGKKNRTKNVESKSFPDPERHYIKTFIDGLIELT